MSDGEEGGAGACAAGVGVLGGVVGDELAGLRETCGGLCLRDGHVAVNHLVVGDLGDVGALLLTGVVAVCVAVLGFRGGGLDSGDASAGNGCGCGWR